MAKFNLADLLSDVSGLNTELDREQLEYIDINALVADDRNFYKLSGIEGLMSSIELLGLQQPVRVRPVDGGYAIVSGHRRCEAIRQLVGEGKENFRMVPCIVESDANSPELQELRLIFANSDTRVLTSSELAQQAARVEELLYKLKEQGMEFPGRMRDHVAEACNISKTKLARLKAIENNLAFELKHEYQSGKLNESCAYALSQLTRYDQLFIFEHLNERKYLYENSIRKMAERLKETRCKTCSHDLRGGTCTHAEALCAKLFSNGFEGYSHCKEGCCSGCSSIGSCKNVCPKLADEAKAAKLASKEALGKAKAEQAIKDAEPIRKLTALWQRFGEARIAAGLDTKELYKLMTNDCYISENTIKRREALELGDKVKRTDDTPYSYCVSLQSVEYLTAAAAALDCSIDYLLCRTDSPRETCTSTQCEWIPGLPGTSGEFLVKFNCAGSIMKRLAYFDQQAKAFYFSRGGLKVNAECLGWYMIPNEEENT